MECVLVERGVKVMEKGYNAQLYEKMLAEQEKYKSWLMSQPPEEILSHAYEYSVREDILFAVEYTEFTEAQAKALLASPCPLDDIYCAREKRESTLMEEIISLIEDRADSLIRGG